MAAALAPVDGLGINFDTGGPTEHGAQARVPVLLDRIVDQVGIVDQGVKQVKAGRDEDTEDTEKKSICSRLKDCEIRALTSLTDPAPHGFSRPR